jgi:hypothetical protein
MRNKKSVLMTLNHNYGCFSGVHYWDLSIKRTDLIDSHEISIVKWGDDEYFTFQLGRGTYRQQIKYVHQLQNLIYPLSGVELEVVW